MKLKQRIGRVQILQEDFLKENSMIQLRMVLDKRNLKFSGYSSEYEYSS